jgi:hypothetical protein
LSKGAKDKHDREILAALGILQIQVWFAGDASLGSIWAPILETVQNSIPASEEVVKYLLSFHGKHDENLEAVTTLLENNLQYITPSTVWIL